MQNNNSVVDGEENPLLGELSERQFRESLDVLLEMTSSDDEQQPQRSSNRTSPLSESLLSAATSAVLGGVHTVDELTLRFQQQSADRGRTLGGDGGGSSSTTALLKPAAIPTTSTSGTASLVAAPMTSTTLLQAAATSTSLPVVPYFATSSSSSTCMVGASVLAAQTTASSAMALAPAAAKLAGMKRRISSAVAPISEDEEEEWMKRRQGRNAREQQRAQQITQQITALRKLLQSFQLDFKPDKFTTLLTATNYIQELQTTSATLSAEHKSVLQTLQQTTEQLHHPVTTPSTAAGIVPYRGVFHACPIALCLINLDGRFLDANTAFERMHHVVTTELVAQRKSLFNLIQRPDIEGMFCAMSQLLSYHPPPSVAATAKDTSMDADTEDSFVRTVRFVVDQKKDTRTVSLRVCLVRSETGLPRYFNCVVLPASDGLQTTG